MAEMSGIRYFLESSFRWRLGGEQKNSGRKEDQKKHNKICHLKKRNGVQSAKEESLTANKQI